MNEDFEHALETLELIEEAAFFAGEAAAWSKSVKSRPNLEWYGNRFAEIQALVRGLSSEIWSLAQAYDKGPATTQEKPLEHQKNQHDPAKAVHAC